jgi:hypothetical protein
MTAAGGPSILMLWSITPFFAARCRTAKMELSLIVLAGAILVGLSVVAMPLHRIAKALEERNRLQTRQTQP